MVNHAGGISAVAFIIAVAVSMGYYQFVYIPQASAKPILPENVLNPSETTEISIAPGSSLPTNGKFFVPKDARGTIGLSNKVVWTNTDTTGHTVTSDDGYVDKINGDFDSLKQGGIIPPGQTFEFTFTEVGQHAYHCEPHPHMQGSIEIVENFA
ncbi:MAG: plastocyanin/azurin family copper-binding protein [Thermoproteota archaeon]|jgi:plastocyanin|nr:plastocyanin/azurin family copper-binding protein [Thermoproteota archaeon]